MSHYAECERCAEQKRAMQVRIDAIEQELLDCKIVLEFPQSEKEAKLKKELSAAKAREGRLIAAMEEIGQYLGWHQDDLSGDDLVGDGRKTKRFKQICTLGEQTFTSNLTGTETLAAIREAMEALENDWCGELGCQHREALGKLTAIFGATK